MTRVIKNGKSQIVQKIKVGVVTIRLFELILNSAQSLLQNKTLLESKKGFRSPIKLPANARDMILWKFSANKGGGSWKFIVNPVNVEKPQSLRHVQPVCKFTANDSRENIHTAMFDENSPHKVDVEDIVHRRCTLINVRIGNAGGTGEELKPKTLLR